MGARFSRKDLYGQPVVLLNVRPINEAYQIEALRLVNLLDEERLSESLVPGIAAAGASRLDAFASGCELVVYDRDQVVQAAVAVLWQARGPRQRPATSRPWWRSCRRSWRARACCGSRRRGTPPPRRPEIDVLRDLFVETAWQRLGLLEELDRRLDLVTLSTLADNMPLRDENRVLVKRGLAAPRPHAAGRPAGAAAPERAARQQPRCQGRDVADHAAHQRLGAHGLARPRGAPAAGDGPGRGRRARRAPSSSSTSSARGSRSGSGSRWCRRRGRATAKPTAAS